MHDVPTLGQLRRRQRCSRDSLAIYTAVLLGVAYQPAQAGGGFDLTLPLLIVPGRQALAASTAGPTDADGVPAFFSDWAEQLARARASQPSWSSPLVTTTGLLEERLRLDAEALHSGNGTSTTLLDGGRGLDLIVGDSEEIQLAAPPYDIRTSRSGKGALSGFADWPFLRVEQRLASSPESGGDYVVTAWLSLQAPTGIKSLTSGAWTFSPTLAFGKGWSNFDIQGTVGVAVPTSHTDTQGHQIQTNIAFQDHVLDVLWPEVEVNWTYYPDGQRGGLNQVYLTTGLVLGRFSLGEHMRFTFGGGYQIAAAPSYRAKPLTPADDHAWLFTSRLNFQ
jgi:hypothetical protein